MKLAYERPVMRAELFQTNAYCAGCTLGGGGKDMVGLNAVKLSDAVYWYDVPAWNQNFTNKDTVAQNSNYSDLVFGGVQKPMTGSWGASQYYWSATSGDKLYHLEWSSGWTDKWNRNGSTGETNLSGDMVFVLYEEDTGDKDLDAQVMGLFPGSLEDNDSTDRYDNSLYAFVFRSDKISTYWSN